MWFVWFVCVCVCVSVCVVCVWWCVSGGVVWCVRVCFGVCGWCVWLLCFLFSVIFSVKVSKSFSNFVKKNLFPKTLKTRTSTSTQIITIIIITSFFIKIPEVACEKVFKSFKKF